MSVIERKDGDGSLRIRGKIGRPGLPDPGGVGGIYQMRPRKNGLVQVKMVYYQPTGTPTTGELLQRQKMRVCMVNWQALSSDEKLRYNRLGKKKRMSGMNWYLHTCLRFVEVSLDNFLDQENGDFLLLESGSKIII